MDEKELELLHQKINVMGNTALRIMEILQLTATPVQLSLIGIIGVQHDEALNDIDKELEAHGYKS